MDKASYVYILASRPYGTLYTGVTANLIQRVWQHRENVVKGYTERYNVHILVWYEIHADIREAIKREKHIKKFNRRWKISMISNTNPSWRDLYTDFTA